MTWSEICVFSGITLVALLVPIALGMYVKRRWPHIAKKILKVGIFLIPYFILFFKQKTTTSYVIMGFSNENSLAVCVSAVHR